MKVGIAAEKIAGGFLLKLTGDVDLHSSPDVRTALADLFKQTGAGIRALLIDLSGVRYMDSSGIATLVEALQVSGKSGIRLCLVDLSAPVRDVFELARLSSVFDIFPSAAAAAAGP